MASKHPYRTVAVALMVALTALGTIPASASAQETTEIDECDFLIDEPGHYEIVDDLVDNTAEDPCITITADDVTLEGNGFTISTAANQPPNGILVNAPDDHKVRIQNVEITGFVNGIFIDAGQVRIQNVDVNNNTDGIDAEGAEKVEVYDSRATNNDDSGIEMDDVHSSEVKNNFIAENGNDGVDIERGKTEIVNNIIRENGEEGVDVEDVFKSVIKDNRIFKNGGEGIEVESDEDVAELHDVKIKDNHIYKNKKNGIDVDGISWKESIDTKIVHNKIKKNGKWGIDVKQVKDLEIKDNKIIKNGKFFRKKNANNFGSQYKFTDLRVINSIKVDIDHNKLTDPSRLTM